MVLIGLESQMLMRVIFSSALSRADDRQPSPENWRRANPTLAPFSRPGGINLRCEW